MSLVAAIRDMLAKGLSLEQALAAAELLESREEARRAKKRAKEEAAAAKAEAARLAKNAKRQRRFRAAKKQLRNAPSRDVTVTNVTQSTGTEHLSELANETVGENVTLRSVTPPSPKKEIPPTPPKEKTTPTVFSDSNESLVGEAADVRDIGEISTGRKRNVELFQTVVSMWNETASGYHLVAVRDITSTRQAAILARSEDFLKTYDFPDAIDGWRKLMGLVRGSPFLRGELNGFRCDFDFATRASSFTKIMEGKYEARQAVKRR